MKNLKYLYGILLFLCIGIAPNAVCQVTSLTQVSVTPAPGPYSCGTVITILYHLEYTMKAGSQLNLSFSLDNNEVNLVSFTPLTSGLFSSAGVGGTASNPIYNYQSSTFTSADNYFSSSTDFTVTLVVVDCKCPPATTTVSASASTTPMPTPNDQQSVSNTINILNSTSAPSITMDVIDGSVCSGTALVKITSVGLDINSTNNSTISLTLPAGVSISGGVNNSNGGTVSATSTSTGSGTTYTWSRSGNSSENMQVDYILLQFDFSVLCPPGGTQFTVNFGLTFSTHSICTGSAATVTPPLFTFTCPCPTTNPNPGDTTIPIPPSGGGVGGAVFFSKTLVKYPYRYFPAPNNCLTHDYFITVDNYSDADLLNFHVDDAIGAIVPGYQDAISVTDVELTLSPLMGYPPVSAFFTAPLLLPASTGASANMPVPLLSDNNPYPIYLYPLGGLWPTADAQWPGSSNLPGPWQI